MKLKEAAIIEIKNLRKYATKEQKGRLDFNTFKKNEQESCIYGQMTGNCNSLLAHKLMDKCAVGKFHSIRWDFSKISKKYTFVDRDIFWTSLEGYIIETPDFNENILSYIKGETNTLEL